MDNSYTRHHNITVHTSTYTTHTTHSHSESIKTSEKDELEKINLATIDNSINTFLLNPIQSGYLLKFSQSEFNAENMIYVLEIDKFKDICWDGKAWSDDIRYKSIDQSIEGFGSTGKTEKDLVFGAGLEEAWPSARIPQSSFIEAAKKIWNTYLANSASTQICMPAKVLSNTIHRLQYLHLYGHKVFDETLIDPIKTLEADVKPRFLSSQHYKIMTIRLKDLFPLPKRNDLHLRLPSKALCEEWDEDKLTVENLREISMNDLFHDRLLYEEFLKYSKRIYSEENVFLIRAISIFKCEVKRIDEESVKAGTIPREVEEQAWLIFRFFIAPGSAYEVSGLSVRRRKEIMLKLAHPEHDMFDAVEKSLLRLVRTQFVNFSFTKEFRAIPAAIIGAAFDKQLARRAEKLALAAEKRREREAVEAKYCGLGKFVESDHPALKHK